MDDLPTTRQLTELLQLDRTTIYRMLSDGRLPAVRIGSQWRFSRPEIASLLQTQNLPGPSSLRADVPSLHYLDSIQRVFAESANIGSVTTDLSGRPIATFRNSCAFCNLILASPSGRARCQASWRELAEQTGPQPHAEVCHAGLTYACAPITVQGKRIAIIFVGQFAVRERSCVDSREHLARVASACAVAGMSCGKPHSRSLYWGRNGWNNCCACFKC